MTGDTIESHLLGHSMFAIETTFTFVDEHTKTDRKLREQRPELTESDRKTEIAQVGTLRAGTQVFSTVAAGAAAGAAIGGPTGFIAGIGIGMAMRIPAANEKSASELLADTAEGVFNFARGLFG